MKKLIFVFLICSIFILNSIPVDALPSEPSTVDSLLGYPIIFTEEANYIELNNTMFVLRFFRDTAGYNEILSKNGTFLVYEDNINLQFLGAGDKWRNRGEPRNISWVQVNDYWWNVSRFYDDFEGTTYVVTYVVKANSPVKISIKINSGQTDEYRVYWYPSGIVLTDWFNETTKLRFGYENDFDNWIAFDWFDVHESFGNITESGVEDHAQGKKAEIWFYVGEIQENETVVVDPSTVGTTTTTTAVQQSWQRHSFFAVTRHWVFYARDDDHICFRSSTDGSTWSSYTDVETITGNYYKGYTFSLWFDGTYIHYKISKSQLNNPIKYRRGTPASDGTISWGTRYNAVEAEAGKYQTYGTITRDSQDYPWIGFSRGTPYTVYVVEANETDGSDWEDPVQLDSTGGTIGPVILPLSGGKLYCIWSYYTPSEGSRQLRGKYYNGASWGSLDTIDTNLKGYKQYGAIQTSDTVHVVYLKGTTNYLCYRNWTSGGGWSSEVELETTTQSTTYPTISSSGSNLYVFYNNATKIRLKKMIGNWQASEDFADTTDLDTSGSFNTFYDANDNKIGTLWLEGTASPWNLRYAFETIGELIQREVTLALTSSWAASRVLTLARSVTLALTSSWTPSRVQTLGRDVTLALSTSWSGTRVLTLTRGVTLPLVTSWAGTRTLTLARGVTLALNATWTADRVLRFPREATLALSTSWSGTRQVSYFVAPVLGLVTSWVATWPVPVVGLDFTLFVILFVIPLGVGLVSRKVLAVVSMLCGFFLFIYGAWLGANPYLATSQLFDETGQEWLTNVETIPMTPWPQVMIALCGIMLIAGSMGAMLRD